MTLSSSMKRFAVALPVAGLLAGGIGTAYAADSTDTSRPARSGAALSTVQAACEKAIDDRLAALDKLAAAVDGRPAVTDAHQATLDGQIADAKSGLSALRDTIAADTDAATLKADCKEVVEGYRVYLVVVPRTHEVVASDALVSGADKLSARVADLQTAIDTAEANGHDVTHDRELLADLQAKVASAHDAAAGVPDTVIGLTAADWNGGTAKPALEAGHATLKTARQDLASALQDAKQIVQDLES
jgi:hypothetical protein